MKPFYSFFTLLICITLIQDTHAQCSPKKGRCKRSDYWEIHAGAGLLPTFVKDRTQTLMPPVLLGVNYRLKPNVSLGFQAGASISEAFRKVPKKSQPALHRNDYTVLSLRAAAHTTNLDRWEVYGGIAMGYGTSQVEVFELNPEKHFESVRTYDKSELYLSAFVGGRFAITRNIGAFTELGLGISLLSGGISWQFR